MLKRLSNRKLSRGHNVVENAFDILKHSFREHLDVTDLHITFFLDVVIACCLLYNVLLGQDPQEVAVLLEILQTEGMRPEVDNNPVEILDANASALVEFKMGNLKRLAIGIFLGRMRNLDVD